MLRSLHLSTKVRPIPPFQRLKRSVAVPSHASRLIIRTMSQSKNSTPFFYPMAQYTQYEYLPMTNQPKKGDDDDVLSTAIVNKKVRTKGFTFVWILSKKCAETISDGNSHSQITNHINLIFFFGFSP